MFSEENLPLIFLFVILIFFVFRNSDSFTLTSSNGTLTDSNVTLTSSNESINNMKGSFLNKCNKNIAFINKNKLSNVFCTNSENLIPTYNQNFDFTLCKKNSKGEYYINTNPDGTLYCSKIINVENVIYKLVDDNSDGNPESNEKIKNILNTNLGNDNTTLSYKFDSKSFSEQGIPDPDETSTKILIITIKFSDDSETKYTLYERDTINI